MEYFPLTCQSGLHPQHRSPQVLWILAYPHSHMTCTTCPGWYSKQNSWIAFGGREISAPWQIHQTVGCFPHRWSEPTQVPWWDFLSDPWASTHKLGFWTFHPKTHFYLQPWSKHPEKECNIVSLIESVHLQYRSPVMYSFLSKCFVSRQFLMEQLPSTEVWSQAWVSLASDE